MCAQMPCLTDSDCHTRCGDHLIHGEAYVCVKNAFLYTYAGVGNDTQAYYIQEPGDDQFDVKNWNTTAEHLGTCMVRLPSPPPPPVHPDAYAVTNGDVALRERRPSLSYNRAGHTLRLHAQWVPDPLVQRRHDCPHRVYFQARVGKGVLW